jgi:hypothetical protein
MHGIFPTHNKYYLASELFPHLSKEEIKQVYFPERKSKKALEASPKPRRGKSDDEEQS